MTPAHRPRLLILAGLILSCLIVPLHSSALGQQLEPIKIFLGSTPHWTNVYVGVDKGYFAKEGIDLQITRFTTGSAATDAFLAGRGDIVQTCELASLGMWERGGAVGIAPDFWDTGVTYIVARPEIKGPADLVGKSVATTVGSTTEYFLALYLKAQRIDTSQIKIVNLPPSAMVPALARGDIVAATEYTPFQFHALKAVPGSYLLTSNTEPYFTERCTTSASADFVKNRRHVLVGFLRALNEANAYTNSHQREAAEMGGKPIQTTADDVYSLISNLHYDMTFDEKYRSDMEEVASFFKKAKPDWAKVFDTSALQIVSGGQKR
jgi:ABC-type nitrate/sulfonate/bicarbonate transport system substrate-binding protein